MSAAVIGRRGSTGACSLATPKSAIFQVPFLAFQEILRLQVAVDDAGFVQVSDPSATWLSIASASAGGIGPAASNSFNEGPSRIRGP